MDQVIKLFRVTRFLPHSFYALQFQKEKRTKICGKSFPHSLPLKMDHPLPLSTNRIESVTWTYQVILIEQKGKIIEFEQWIGQSVSHCDLFIVIRYSGCM